MKGLFIPDITAEMFRNGCLEGIEALMAEGEIYDIEYDLKSAQRKKGEWKRAYLDHELMGERPSILYCSVCNQCIAYPVNYCPNCGANMRGENNVDNN